MKVIELHRSVTESNDRDAEELRGILKKNRTFLINLMSSAGAGKTTFLSRTISDLKEKYRIAVLEADIDASVDAERIEALGARSIQVHTDGMCHMDAGMTRAGLEAMGMEDTDIVFLENIGNLICPAEYDTGAVKKVMILSVPEGDDKPLKYPLMFQVSDCCLVNKIDAKEVFDFSEKAFAEAAKMRNPDITILPVSALTGEGFDSWIRWLEEKISGWKE